MATMAIRNIDDRLKARLRVQAAKHGRSMEDEARSILCTALSTEPESGESLYDAIRAIVEPLGGVELELPPPASPCASRRISANDPAGHQRHLGAVQTQTERARSRLDRRPARSSPLHFNRHPWRTSTGPGACLTESSGMPCSGDSARSSTLRLVVGSWITTAMRRMPMRTSPPPVAPWAGRPVLWMR